MLSPIQGPLLYLTNSYQSNHGGYLANDGLQAGNPRSAVLGGDGSCSSYISARTGVDAAPSQPAPSWPHAPTSGVPREPLRGQRKDDEDPQATHSGPWVPGDTVKGPGLQEVPSPFQTFKCKARKVIHWWVLRDGGGCRARGRKSTFQMLKAPFPCHVSPGPRLAHTPEGINYLIFTAASFPTPGIVPGQRALRK